jgi:hypothetical protein
VDLDRRRLVLYNDAATRVPHMSSGMWYRAALTTEQVAAGDVDAIRRLFVEAMNESGAPAGACLFITSHDTRAGKLRDNAEGHIGLNADAVFFSPASISAVPHLIAQYQARPSEPPDRSRAALLVGQDSDWSLLPHSTH